MSALLGEMIGKAGEEAALIALEEGGEIEGSTLLKKTQNLGSRVLNSQGFQFIVGGALEHKAENLINNYVVQPVKNLTGFSSDPDNITFPSNSVTISKTGDYDGIEDNEDQFNKPAPESSVMLGSNPDIADMYHNKPATTTFAQDASRF